ncbi:MAG TPA: asparagine synthase (glutamine-hydrolyzing) [Methylomirabilota bacterium]|nr:asparagine synthase (glutamine-hydrolyzing) [Methylomirabilota bacterium]
MTGFLEHRLHDGHRATVRRMTDTLRHRGPDSEGFHLDDFVALGVRRLSIIDRETGDQPISNESGTVWGALNGEIYNFRALRAQLEGRGHRFRTRSDTEVLVHAYEEYGEACVSHFEGMFACVVWDAPRRLLFLARDRMGEKPLYYAAGPDAFVFGSELRAILAHPAVPRELSPEGLAAYLAFEYVPDPQSMIAGVAKLPPGHTLSVSPGDPPRIKQYWDISFAPDDSVHESEWCARVLGQLETSVRQRLVADVPVGIFLSGGLDSSAVVALAARAGGGAVQTFSLGFEEPSYDERAFARAVAQHCGTDHHEITFTPADGRRLLDEVGDLLDEPLVDGSFLPTYALSRFARRSITVALSGDGGDELFCGYPTFLAERGARWLERWPRWLVTATSRAVERLPSSPRYGSVDFLLKQFFRGLPHDPALRTQLLLGGLTAPERARLVSPWLAPHCARADRDDTLARALTGVIGLGPLERAIYQHCKFYLAGQNLATVDRASMASGLEVRAPFLDHNLVELAGRVPSALKVRGLTTKYILKRALHGVLPPAILERRKQGFGVPIGLWLRGPLRPVLEERLSPERVAHVGLFDPAATGRLVAEHLGGRHDHRKILWALLMFDAWRERYLPGLRWS